MEAIPYQLVTYTHLTGEFLLVCKVIIEPIKLKNFKNLCPNYFFYNLAIARFCLFPELIRIFGHTSSQPLDIDGNPILQAGSLASQFCPLGPKERCTASQAQTMGEQILKLMIMHENNGKPLPCEFGYFL